MAKTRKFAQPADASPVTFREAGELIPGDVVDRASAAPRTIEKVRTYPPSKAVPSRRVRVWYTDGTADTYRVRVRVPVIVR